MSEDCYLPRRLAQWNPTRGAWETGQHDLLSTLSELYLATWPASGMTLDGVVYELPTPELHTDGSGSSSLLPTPRTTDMNGPGKHGAGGQDLRTTIALLPTPAANDSGNTPEQHLRKKPGRMVVTSLQVMADHDLIRTGGRIVPQSNGGDE